MEKKKVYLAILNHGNLRREMKAQVIPSMAKTEGITLIWENPDKTWANPISSNRNLITKRFLATDCDYLLMIDDDVVPMHNPCEMVAAMNSEVDIIGSPALVRASGQTMVWTAYTPHSSGIGYSAIDLNNFDDMFDLLEVAIVGTGCILIKRKVLEALKAPFHCEYDEDGIVIYGTDFAFCRKATKAGFHVYTTMHRRCEHYKIVGLSNIDAWDRVDYFDRCNAEYGIHWGGMSITQKDWYFITKIIEEIKPIRILEFGAGLSSFLLSEICEVISYETDPEYIEEIRSKITAKNNLTIRLWDGHNAPADLQTYANIAKSVKGKSFDLAFVDGPKQKQDGGIGRYDSIRIASQVSDNVILHDAGRMEEEHHQRKHFRSIFKLTNRSGNHLTRCHYWKRRPYPVTLEEVKEKLSKRKK